MLTAPMKANNATGKTRVAAGLLAAACTMATDHAKRGANNDSVHEILRVRRSGAEGGFHHGDSTSSYRSRKACRVGAGQCRRSRC
jgi:hypothetical protein